MILSPKVELTSEFIFSKISNSDIYNLELPGLCLKQVISSPLRVDKTPSFGLVISNNNQMRHLDFSYPDDNRFSGGAIDFIMSRYGLNYDNALKKIAQDFHLLENGQKYKEITEKFTKPVMDIKRNCLIQVESRKWKKEDIEYWLSYGITLAQLKQEEVYPIKNCWINRRNHPIHRDEIAFAYRFPMGFKLYFPTREKQEKWKSNIPTSTIENIKGIENSNRVIVTKSRKDLMVLSRYIPGVISVQNETRAAFNNEFVSQLQGKQVFINFDSDVVGKTNSIKLTKEYGFNHLNVPDKYLPKAKDYSDLYRYYGEDAIIEHLKSKKLL